MMFYKTLTTVRFPSGTKLALSHEQSIPRKHLLEPDVDGMVIAQEPLEFKAGEIIGLKHVSPVFADQLERVEFEDDGGDDMIGIGRAPTGSQETGEVIESTIGKRPDHAKPGEQMRPESGEREPVADASDCSNDAACTDGLGVAKAVATESVKSRKKSAK